MSDEIEINEKGGAQSKLDGRYDMVPGEAIQRIAGVFAEGAQRYARNNWRRIAYEDHVDHALQHLAKLIADDRSEDHLGHAATRLLMAIAMENPDFLFTALGPEVKRGDAPSAPLKTYTMTEYEYVSPDGFGSLDAILAMNAAPCKGCATE